MAGRVQETRCTRETQINSGLSDLFVGREKEVSQVGNLLNLLQPKTRVVRVSGPRGSGKTTFLAYLHEEVIPKMESSCVSTLVRISPNDLEGSHNKQNCLHIKNHPTKDVGDYRGLNTLLHFLASQYNIDFDSTLILLEKIDSIVKYIGSHRDTRFVLIIDGEFNSWNEIKNMEKGFFRNLLSLENFYLIISEEGRPRTWTNNYVNEGAIFKLKPFEEPELEDQVKKLGIPTINGDILQTIYDIGKGYPIFTDILAKAKDPLSKKTLVECIYRLFSELPYNKKEKNRIFDYLKALSVFDTFSEAEVRALFPKANAKEEITKLSRTGLISWKDGGYKIDPSLKAILDLYMDMYDPSVLLILGTAIAHLKELSNKKEYKKFKKIYEEKIRALIDRHDRLRVSSTPFFKTTF
ncbi:ATP-binding protein [Patescibacteria group bacterium]|nr:ATP-binding protein [Patescibacteria group bacterium]